MASLTAVSFGQSSGDCLTPFKERGTCIAIRDCTTIWQIVTRAPRPLSDRVLKFLQSSICEDPALHKVCCRYQDVAQGTQNPALIDSTPSVANDDVVNHRNLNLLDTRSCGPISSDRIAYGNSTSLFEFPWMALLEYEDSNGRDFKCGGALINKRFSCYTHIILYYIHRYKNNSHSRYVLTAAHCVSNLRRGTRLTSVRLGEYDVTKEIDCQITNGEQICAPPIQDIRIEKIIAHPGFNNPRWANDIALLRLSSEPDFSEFAIAPICLPVTSELMNLRLSTITVTGWGKKLDIHKQILYYLHVLFQVQLRHLEGQISY